MVWGLGFRVQGLWFRVCGLGVGVTQGKFGRCCLDLGEQVRIYRVKTEQVRIHRVKTGGESGTN
jgi:hypothetical protein